MDDRPGQQRLARCAHLCRRPHPRRGQRERQPSRRRRARAGLRRPNTGSARGWVRSARARIRSAPTRSTSVRSARTTRTSVVGRSPIAANPAGTFDDWTVSSPGIRVTGWAIDADTAAPVGVHVYVDGNFAGQTTANLDRPDVGGAFGWAGADHGYALEVAALPGAHTRVRVRHQRRPGREQRSRLQGIRGSRSRTIRLVRRGGAGRRAAPSRWPVGAWTRIWSSRSMCTCT